MLCVKIMPDSSGIFSSNLLTFKSVKVTKPKKIPTEIKNALTFFLKFNIFPSFYHFLYCIMDVIFYQECSSVSMRQCFLSKSFIPIQML